jgi:hypothetical protein
MAMATRRQFYIKTKHKRRKPAPPPLRKETAPEASPRNDWALPPQAVPAREPAKRGLNWKTVVKLTVALPIIGYGIYFLATSEAGRAVYRPSNAGTPTVMPSYPGNRGASLSSLSNKGIEHSLSNRAQPTAQSFIDTYGGTRSVGSGAPRTEGNSGSSEGGELPDKIKLREDLAGNCDIGGDGRTDIASCLRRYSAPGG